MAKFIMAQYKDNLLGEANSFLEVLEQVSRLARWINRCWSSASAAPGKSLSLTVSTTSPAAGEAVYLVELRGAER